MCPVARSHPQFAVIHVWRYYLLVATLAVHDTNHVNQRVVHVSAIWDTEAAAGAKLMEEVELLLLLGTGHVQERMHV